ncbi:fungal-specific transcription factor domain-containing protein [Dactylonectria macrodidyma]|uniref:Fungal-specific transcription factor domain-containing protein n=1 Tax=Dactylonectria macrodidyma TaxID=307937 RepID=A0A9P9EQM3_9HYPO|nr:fungal-specific transcription factor domain-containing protein [Dactylonectria macrodidyma]
MTPPTPQSDRLAPRHRQLPATRLRAPKACLKCRERKVRCDVSMRGSPCTNCLLDGKTCTTVDRASRRTESTERDCHTRDQIPESYFVRFEIGVAAGDKQTPENEASPPLLEEHPEQTNLRNAIIGTSTTTCPRANDTDSWCDHTTDSQSMSTETEMPYTSCKFLDSSNLSRLSSQDLSFIEAKGCLSIPVKRLLDEFIRQYFLHVHPFLPILDEGAFWRAYQQEDSAGSLAAISLLVFQAMLFASCGFIAPTVITGLGFKSIRSARSSFFHKAKLLYDFNTEASSISMAQASLLMTFWASPESHRSKLNTMWLKIALHHAKCAGAHKAWESSTASNCTIPHFQQDQRMLRRLWWGCIIRDHFMSMGLKRSLQITRPYPVLYMSDFQSEISRSEVHSPETKRRLIRISLRLMDLCNTLTELILLVSPSDDSLAVENPDIHKLTECRTTLRDWHAKTEREISSSNSSGGLRQHSIIVHTHTMYIFYYTSRTTLIHQEILLSCYKFRTHQTISRENCRRSQEVIEANVGLIECLRELMELDLIRYLPLSVLAFTAMPLFHHVLNTRLMPSSEHATKLAANQHHLKPLTEALKVYQRRYDGVEWVSYAVRITADLAQLDSVLSSNTLARSWTDLLIQQPTLYLRLTLGIYLSISHVNIPDDQDFPVILRGVLSPKLPLIRGPNLEDHGTTRQIQAPEPHDNSIESGALIQDQITFDQINHLQSIDLHSITTPSVVFSSEALIPEANSSRTKEPGVLPLNDFLFRSPNPETLDNNTSEMSNCDDETLSNEMIESTVASCNYGEVIDLPDDVDMFLDLSSMDYGGCAT